MRTGCIVFFVILSTLLAAQTVKEPVHPVMIIPYDPQFYLSDADHEIMEETQKEPARVRESFRRTLDLYVQRAIASFRPCISVLNDADSLASLRQALITAYSHTGYRYENVMPLPLQKEHTDSLARALRKTNREALDSRTARQYYIMPPDARFMNAVFNKSSFLQDLFAEYGTGIFVFLNQFEIKTNYKNCLDIANKIYQRELMVHFSVYDYTGKQLAGSYAIAFFPSDSNHASDIMKNCFPEIARTIASCIP